MEHEVVERPKPYAPNKKTLDYISDVLDCFDTGDQNKQQKYPELNNFTPIEMVDESRMRVAGYLPEQDKDVNGNTQGANVFFQKSRNKRNIIRSFMAAQRPRAEISAFGKNATKTDKRIAQIELNAYDHFMLLDNADELYLDWQTETLDTGTGFLYTYYDYQEREVKSVTKTNWETGEQEYKTSTRVVSDRPRSKVVPFEQLYFPTLYETDIQNYPWVIYREYILRSVAEQIYGKFKNWKYVPFSGGFDPDSNTGEQFFYKRWQSRVQDPFVEIIHRFKKVPDTHDILINGVLMTEIGNPMLYDHKEYPFIPNYYEKIKGFILGMSLPMKMMWAQDVFNELMNANINRSRSSSHVAFLSSLESEIQQDSVGTWEIIKTDDDANLRELKVQGIGQGDIEMIRMLGVEIDETTAQRIMDGSISGETATAIMNAVRQSMQNMGPQLIHAYTAASKHAELFLKNILQFFFNANLKGEHFEMKEINLEDVKLQDGQKGIRVIRVVESKDKIPSKAEREKELERGMIETIDAKGKKTKKVETNYDIVYMTPDDIADMQSKIKIVAGSSLPDIQSLDKALQLELDNLAATPMFQPYADFEALWKQTVEKFGANPDDVTKQQDLAAAPAAQEMQTQQALANQSAPQSQGQPQGAPANSQLVESMTKGSSPSLNQLLNNAPTA